MSYRPDRPPSIGEYYHVYNRGVEKRVTFNDDRDYQRFLEIVEYYLPPNRAISFSQRNRFHRPEPDIQHRVLDIRQRDIISTPLAPLIEIVAFCLMPNHFHFLIKVISEAGLQNWIRLIINSYTRSFNIRWDRVGPLFQGPYKFVHISSNNQLLHLSRYIHLNPVIAKLTIKTSDWRWSSMHYYHHPPQISWLKPRVILDQFRTLADYEQFIEDHIAYASSVASINKLLIDPDN